MLSADCRVPFLVLRFIYLPFTSGTSMRQFQSVLFAIIFSATAFAQGTRAWEQSRFDEFEKGTPKGVAIRSDGTLILAPAFKSLYTTPSTYIWAIASDDQAVYAASGAPSRV